MSNDPNKSKFASSCTDYVGFVRSCLKTLDRRGVGRLLDRCRRFNQEVIPEDSFRSINQRVERILAQCDQEDMLPDPLELETIELAIDWLEQLAALYAENLPRPKTLIQELLYTFDLVERSRGVATSLSGLLAQRASAAPGDREDPFEQDPEFSVDESSAEPQDPFAGDPGFGMEFDLLQRTLSLERKPLPKDDIFIEDESFES